MKYVIYFLQLFLILGNSCAGVALNANADTNIITPLETTIIRQADSSVIVYCVRHAEKSSIGNNPSLNLDGMVRATDLSHVLSNIDLAAVYSTNYNRTRETAIVSATDHGLNVTIYDAHKISEFAKDVIQRHKGESVLVVGHSNTTPQFINALTSSTDYTSFNELTYDNLYIVKINIDGTSEVIHLEYGADSP